MAAGATLTLCMCCRAGVPTSGSAGAAGTATPPRPPSCSWATPAPAAASEWYRVGPVIHLVWQGSRSLEQFKMTETCCVHCIPTKRLQGARTQFAFSTPGLLPTPNLWIRFFCAQVLCCQDQPCTSSSRFRGAGERVQGGGRMGPGLCGAHQVRPHALAHGSSAAR